MHDHEAMHLIQRGNDLEEAVLNVYNSIENVTKLVHGAGDAFASTLTVQFVTIFDGRMGPDGPGAQLKPGIDNIDLLALIKVDCKGLDQTSPVPSLLQNQYPEMLSYSHNLSDEEIFHTWANAAYGVSDHNWNIATQTDFLAFDEQVITFQGSKPLGADKRLELNPPACEVENYTVEDTTIVSNMDTLTHSLHGDIFSFLFPNNEESTAYAYFLQSVSMIIPACDSSQNGYRQLAILALSTPVLMGTVISISTTYMHLRGGAPVSLALQRQSQALATLRDSISDLTNPDTTTSYCESLRRDILATILLQITVEIASGGRGAQTHIDYAWNLFRELGYEQRKPTCPIGTVLVQRITYIDILSSIFWQRRPFLPLSFWFINQQCTPDGREESSPTFQETTGCPHWVISLLARISHLSADDATGMPHTVVMSQAHELQTDLHVAARTYITPLAGQSSLPNKQRHLDIVGQCFYWGAVLLLQRRIFHDRRNSCRVQSALIVLIQLMESLPIGCGPDSALSLPLYLAALEAIDPDHRMRIRRKSCQLTKEYPSKTRETLTMLYDAIWADIDMEMEMVEKVGDAKIGRRRGQLSAATRLVKERCLFIC
ncbi:hypothetical protein FQN52_003366 [Onygenales sp. PD_12]|nr:hypothetical protein FQN52_003366 [Onygenales sp. PD_12]